MRLSIYIFVFAMFCGACSSPQGPLESESMISDDPAIFNPSLALVVKPGWRYKDIKVKKLNQTNCTVTRSREPLIPLNWISSSGCDVKFQESEGIMQGSANAIVLSRLNGGVPIFTETTVAKSTLMREFTVESNGINAVKLTGTDIRFNVQWLGRLFSSSLNGESSCMIEFLLRDLTTNEITFRRIIPHSELSITGKLKTISAKGIPIPVPLPDWQKNEVDDEPFADSINLTTGHTYRLELVLIATANSGIVGLFWESRTNFNAPVMNVGNFKTPGFVKWMNIELDIGTE